MFCVFAYSKSRTFIYYTEPKRFWWVLRFGGHLLVFSWFLWFFKRKKMATILPWFNDSAMKYTGFSKTYLDFYVYFFDFQRLYWLFILIFLSFISWNLYWINTWLDLWLKNFGFKQRSLIYFIFFMFRILWVFAKLSIAPQISVQMSGWNFAIDHFKKISEVSPPKSQIVFAPPYSVRCAHCI